MITQMEKDERDPLTEKIIGCCFKVHTKSKCYEIFIFIKKLQSVRHCETFQSKQSHIYQCLRLLRASQ